MPNMITRHPYISGIVGIVGLIVIYRMASGGTTSTTVSSGGMDPTAVASATALAQAQMAAQSHTADINAAASAQNAQIAGQVTIAQMQEQLGLATVAANAQSSTQQTAAALDVARLNAASTDLASTLTARVQQAGIDAQTAAASIAAHTTETQTAAMVSMNASNQATIQSSISESGATSRAQIKANSGMCFITTAACDVVGVPDDGYALTTLRTWRDTWLKHNAPDEIARYCAEAPGIVSGINARPDAATVYTLVWHDYILPAISCIERGQHRAAYAIYASMFATLQQLTERANVGSPYGSVHVD